MCIWPSGKLPFECQKMAKKLDIFFKKNDKNCHFFQQKFCWKKWQFLSIFLKKISSFGQFFDIQMSIIRRVRSLQSRHVVKQSHHLIRTDAKVEKWRHQYKRWSSGQISSTVTSIWWLKTSPQVQCLYQQCKFPVHVSKYINNSFLKVDL